MKFNRTTLKNTLKVLVSLGLITWLVSRINYEEFIGIIRQGDPKYFALAIGALVIGFFFQSYRLHILIRSLTYGLGHSMKIFFIGFFFNNLLPSSIGGDAVRMYYLRHSGNSNWETPFSMLFFHRLVGFIVLFTGGVVYTLFRFPKVQELIISQMNVQLEFSLLQEFLVGGLILVIIAIGYIFRRKIFDFLKNCRWAFENLKFREYLAVFLLAAGFHFFRMIGFTLLLFFFNQSFALVDFVFILFATALIALIPISLGGLGVVEGTIAGLLGIYGVMESAAIGLALINRAFLLLISLTGGIFYMASNINPPEATKPESTL